jgi:hypothetical protein
MAERLMGQTSATVEPTTCALQVSRIRGEVSEHDLAFNDR